ncbi:hypothetical protein [Sorlinia euscelidii]|uniref:hypothetical protein n=1 Tax=Sorlinia euscelidii TaxID=3081148 RepID=UPI003AAED175
MRDMQARATTLKRLENRGAHETFKIIFPTKSGQAIPAHFIMRASRNKKNKTDVIDVKKSNVSNAADGKLCD